MVKRAVRPDRIVTTIEKKLLDILRASAIACEPKPTNMALSDMLDVSNGGTVPEMISRLEAMGLIEVDRWQRSSRICFPDGKCTAMPLNTAPHWRDRPKEMPSVSVATVRQRKPDIASEIITWASRRGVPICDAIADLAFVGWQVEKERA